MPDPVEVRLRVSEAVIKAMPREALHDPGKLVDSVAIITTFVLKEDKADAPKSTRPPKKRSQPTKAKSDKGSDFLD